MPIVDSDDSLHSMSQPRSRVAEGDRTEKLRVVLLARSFSLGGTERQIVQLARGLAGRGHTTHLVTFYGGDEFHQALAGTTVQIHDLKKSGRWDFLHFMKKARACLADLSPDVIYSFLTPPNLVAASLRRFLPDHRQVWGVRASHLNLSHYDPVIGITTWFEQRLAHIPDVIVSNSEAGRRDAIARGYPASKMCVVPNGIDTATFSLTTPESRARARALLEIEAGTIAVGMVARLDPMKDHRTFLRALAQVAAKRQVCGVLAGPPGRPQQLTELANEIGIVDRLLWLGPVQEVQNLYPALDVLCLTSAYGEGFPNVIGEAMACGIPCVVTDVGDCREILSGLAPVVAAGDVGAIAVAILAAIEQRRADPNLPQRLRDRIVERYGLERMVETTEAQLYRRIGARCT